MKHSIRTRLILVLTGMIVLVILSLFVVNRLFLSDYYEQSKTQMMENVFEKVNAVYQTQGEEGGDSQDSQPDLKDSDSEEKEDKTYSTLERIGANNGIELSVFSIYATSFEWVIDFKFCIMSEMQKRLLKERLQDYILSEQSDTPIENSKDVHLMASGERYNIYRVYDKRMGSNYLELIGVLDNDDWVYVRTNYQSMRESVNISNMFLAYVGIIVTIVGIIIMFFVGRSFTKPILNLYEIAEHMKDLDFNVRYTGDGKDEIGVLGQSMNAMSDKLEKTISELKSANNELQTDIERKIQIDEMRQEFLSNVSHELKTPIALIQGYAEGLQENINEDADSREFYCEVIIDEANKMNKMVKKLLSLNQIECGNNQVQFERFNIWDVFESVLNASKILFQQKEVKLLFEKSEPIFVWADEYFMEEVVANFISNALNHVTHPNEIRIFATFRDNGVVRFSVFNTGEIIPEDELEKIWIKFYKVDKARTREYGGNGIGLSIVKAIMTSMNRECGVINHDNGVEFWFELDTRNE